MARDTSRLNTEVVGSMISDAEFSRMAAGPEASNRELIRVINLQSMRRSIGNPARLLRTVRHLRAGQLVNRVVRQFKIRPASDGPRPQRRVAKAIWQNCPGRHASMLSPTLFHFVGHQATLNSPADWNAAGRTKLWLYNLHYFDDLRAADAAVSIAVASRSDGAMAGGKSAGGRQRLGALSDSRCGS